MSASEEVERVYRETRWEPGQEARVKERAARLMARPATPEQLIASGEASELSPWGEYHDYLVVLHELKKARIESGLGLGEVAARTGMDRAAISRLENGQTNPTMQTIVRYATGIGKRLKIVFEDLTPRDPDPDAPPALA
jgi:DNA-binding XRE family transcriptional regulator